MSSRVESTQPVAAMAGNLDSIPLFDLCQFLLLNRRTGTVTVKHDGSIVRIYFESGQILDITDDALHTGDKVLLGAVQWTEGTFSFDPQPTGVEQRISVSTETLLLEAARTIDEFRARSGGEPSGPTQESIFRERQSFAGELADAFRTAMDPMDRPRGSSDPLWNLLEDLQESWGTLLLRGNAALLRGGDGIRPFPCALGPEELLQRLHLPPPEEGETRNHRFEKPPGWFHLRSRRLGGELQIRLASLRSEIPRPQEIGLDPGAYEPLLRGDGGLILWSGVPRGLRSTALTSWLGHSNGTGRGLTLWLEESPRIAWEVASWISRHVGEPHVRDQIPGLLEWSAETLVVDSVRLPDATRLALETAEAGMRTVAVTDGLTPESSLGSLLERLKRSGVEDGNRRLARVLSGWVGVVPLVTQEGTSPVVAAQVVTFDRESIVASMESDRAGLLVSTRSIEATKGFAEEIDRLTQEGKITSAIVQSLRCQRPELGL